HRRAIAVIWQPGKSYAAAIVAGPFAGHELASLQPEIGAEMRTDGKPGHHAEDGKAVCTVNPVFNLVPGGQDGVLLPAGFNSETGLLGAIERREPAMAEIANGNDGRGRETLRQEQPAYIVDLISGREQS